MKKTFNKSWPIFFLLSLAFSSCKKFLDINPPKTSLVSTTVFKNNDQATAAITNIYSTMAGTGSYASGSNVSITCLSGLSSDELLSQGPTNVEFYDNQISPTSTTLPGLYSGPYNSIYKANAVIEGLTANNGTTPAVKTQLLGEAYFIRAFNYFYLVNLFGPVPLQLTTDYTVTRTAPRAPINDVYDQILKDLKLSETMLTDVYATTERVRPNLAAVQALLARVYLYTKDWANAEKYASLVMAKTGTYSLVVLDNVFLKNSQEAIWQLFPPANSNAPDGTNFILTGTPTFVSLRNTLALNGFDPNDKRLSSWVKSLVTTTGTYYYPFKYKVKSSTTVTEYSMVLRLAEQYLIRAEAEAEQNKLAEAIKDVDAIRIRAGAVSNNIGANSSNSFKTVGFSNPGISQLNLLSAIQNERRVELFTEWGHRWLDLKRTNQANTVLTPLKSQWVVTDVLYPIPNDETSRNSSVNQNPGY